MLVILVVNERDNTGRNVSVPVAPRPSRAGSLKPADLGSEDRRCGVSEKEEYGLQVTGLAIYTEKVQLKALGIGT